MSTMLLAWAITAAQVILGAAIACSFWRLVQGPRAQDRVLGFDTLYVNVMLVIITLGVQTGRMVYYEAALVIALLGFSTTVALAKFLMRGEVIE
ncbi:MAG: K+/H+ antiporter subunit F [Alphaproteobacteria bacterium 65-7]|nr:MAG: K+/H+ antiporter subunit F [Alphaproteobacteria bacterium 65-7]